MTQEDKIRLERIGLVHGMECKERYEQIARTAASTESPDAILEKALAASYPEHFGVDGRKLGKLRFNSQ